MARLPTPGGDNNTWGDVLNEYLGVEHDSDGSQKTVTVTKGGTGATDAATARTNLGAAASSDLANYSRTATFVVAASDASTKIKAVADYVCDGTADDVQIQAALAALGAAGGTVILSEGTFNVAAAISLASDAQSLVGQGPAATIISTATDINVVTVGGGAAGWTENQRLRGFKIDGKLNATTPALQVYGARFLAVRDVWTIKSKWGVLVEKAGKVLFDSCRFNNADEACICLCCGRAPAGGTQPITLITFINCGTQLSSNSDSGSACIQTRLPVNEAATYTLEDEINEAWFIGCNLDANNVAASSCLLGRQVGGSPDAPGFWGSGFIGCSFDSPEAAAIDLTNIPGVSGSHDGHVWLTVMGSKFFFVDSGALVKINNNQHFVQLWNSSTNNGSGGTGNTQHVFHVTAGNPVLVLDGFQIDNMGAGGSVPAIIKVAAGSPVAALRNIVVESGTLYIADVDAGATLTAAVEGAFQRIAGTVTNVNGAGTITLSTRPPQTQVKAEAGGAISVADGGTVTHGLYATPTYVQANPSVSGEMVSITAVGAATFTVAIKKHDGTAGTTQVIYWRAWV